MDSGCYRLHIKISRDIKVIVGALGQCLFLKGNYIYTGSALKNLSKRVERHYRKEKKLHWHIDYLTAHKFVKIEYIELIYTSEKIECELNLQLFKDYDVSVPFKGFGSSDCKCCPTHFVKIVDE